MRTYLVSLTSLFLLVAACGGKTNGGGGGNGSSSSSGSSGSSGGSSGSSGGVSSSGGGSGGEGATCTPLPGCDSSLQCPAEDGCNTCECADGHWSCTTLACIAEGGIGPGNSLCPDVPPNVGTGCGQGNFSCGYVEPNGCDETCTCENETWSCAEGCVTPACPPTPPAFDSACDSVGMFCSWDLGGFTSAECECDSSGIWSCGESGCSDGGFPDTGGPDTGTPDEGPPGDGGIGFACPVAQPAESSACSEEGAVCDYGLCPTNCLCASGAWVCAKEQGCP